MTLALTCQRQNFVFGKREEKKERREETEEREGEKREERDRVRVR